MKLRLTLGVVAAILLILPAALGACDVSLSDATRALSATGITNIQIGGHAWLQCSKHDAYSVTFTGTGANGQPISGAICQGFFKGITIRYD